MVSVVIPAFNAEEFIVEAITSVFSQTHRPIELVIVNDGSTDSTMPIIEEQAALAPDGTKVKAVNLERNQGASNAVNVGFATATGDYICWLSADDVFLDPRRIEKQLYQMTKTKALWSYSRDFRAGANISEATLIKPSWVPYLRVLDPLFVRNPSLRLVALLFRNPINGSSVMLRRDCVEKYGNFDPVLRNVDADGDLWMRYSVLKLRLAVLEGTAIFYREHPNQLSRRTSNMIYGSELTRMRILLTLERSGRLLELVRRSVPLLLIFFVTKSYLNRPVVAKFLCQYILAHRKNFNRVVRRLAEKALIAAGDRLKSLGINESKLLSDTTAALESPTFTSFEEMMGAVGEE